MAHRRSRLRDARQAAGRSAHTAEALWPPGPKTGDLVTREELAQIMRVSVPTIDRMLRSGMRDAAAVSWGRRLIRIRVADAVRWAEQQHPD